MNKLLKIINEAYESIKKLSKGELIIWVILLISFCMLTILGMASCSAAHYVKQMSYVSGRDTVFMVYEQNGTLQKQ